MEKAKRRMACPECMAVFVYEHHMESPVNCPFCGLKDLLSGTEAKMGVYHRCEECERGWVLDG